MYKISLVFWSIGEFGILLSKFTDLYKDSAIGTVTYQKIGFLK